MLNRKDLRRKNNWQPLLVFCSYRIVLVASLLLLFITNTDFSKIRMFSYFTAEAYSALLCGIYLIPILISLVLYYLRRPNFSAQVHFAVIVDVIFLALLLQYNNTLFYTVGILINVAVVGGSIITAGRTSLFFAAIGAIAVLLQHVYAGLSSNFFNINFIDSATLGVTFFSTALLGYMLSRRLRREQIVTEQQACDIVNLERLNQFIVQKMAMGVVALDHQDRISLLNHSASQLLNVMLTATPKTLEDIAPELASLFQHWRKKMDLQSKVLDSPKFASSLQVTICRLDDETYNGAVLFFEDLSEAQQQAQQLKLASLGQLTASIAHEIRNPLSAVSHAAELLSVSEELSGDDKRCSEIISDNSRRINEVITNILQLSRRQKDNSEWLDLSTWLHSFMRETLAVDDRQWDVNINVQQANLLVQANKSHLCQVLVNLCENGIRHTEQYIGQQKLLLVLGQLDDKPHIYLDIIDYGQGIDAAMHEKIFEPFFTTERSGTGLGLYMAKELCEANRVKLSYRRTDANESCFRLVFFTVKGEL